ncbi:hypothetical protein D3C71_1484200 [compost metagenome]
MRHVTPAFGFGPIHLDNDGRQHRRAWRHLHHLDIGTMALADLLQRRPYPHGNGVALVLAMVFVDQVDLDITHFATCAQVVLAHQSVEIDGP